MAWLHRNTIANCVQSVPVKEY